MRKRNVWAALLLCCTLTLTGCMNSPPDVLLREGTDGQRLISASAGQWSGPRVIGEAISEVQQMIREAAEN